MNKLVKKLALSAALLAQSCVTYTSPQKIVNDVKNAIKTDAYYCVEAAGIVAMGMGGVIGSMAFHENGWKYMELNKKVTSGALLLTGTGLFCAHHNLAAAVLYLAVGLACTYYATKPTPVAIDLKI